MIKHIAPNNVLSYFNPMVSLKPKMKLLVNENFFLPIAAQFFMNLGGIELYEPLDMDKIKTEIDFDNELNFVNNYLYTEIIESIKKEDGGGVHFTPKYVFTFDRELTPNSSTNIYPFYGVLKDFECEPEKISYGCMRLGEAPVLYYIWVDMQMLIKFIKQYPSMVNWDNPNYKDTPSEKQLSKAYYQALSEIQLEKLKTSDVTRLKVLEEQEAILRTQAQSPSTTLLGKTGKLRINLQWETTDDLDLHVSDPDQNEIFYGKKSAICQGKRGELDVDMNAGTPFSSHPQENIVWEIPPSGKFEVWVELFTKRDTKEMIPFTVRILPENMQGRIYSGVVTESEQKARVVDFEFSEEIGIFNDVKFT